MGNIVKNFFSFGCSGIASNNNYICAAGDKIGIISKSNSSLSKTISGIRNVSSVCLDEKRIYAKKTNGTLYVFDLATQSLLEKHDCLINSKSAQDFPIYSIGEGVILDLLYLNNEQHFLTKYSFLQNITEKIAIPISSDYVCSNYLFESGNAYLLFKEKCFANKFKTNCLYVIVDTETMKMINMKSFSFEHKIHPYGLIDKNYLLLNNMQIVNIKSSERVLLSTSNFEQSDPGYFCRIIPSFENVFILVFSKTVVVYNLHQNNTICKYCGKYFSSALYDNGKLYIGTWDGMFEV